MYRHYIQTLIHNVCIYANNFIVFLSTLPFKSSFLLPKQLTIKMRDPKILLILWIIIKKKETINSIKKTNPIQFIKLILKDTKRNRNGWYTQVYLYDIVVYECCMCYLFYCVHAFWTISFRYDIESLVYFSAFYFVLSIV